MTYLASYRCHRCGVAWKGAPPCWACQEPGEPLALPSLTNPYQPPPEHLTDPLVL